MRLCTHEFIDIHTLYISCSVVLRSVNFLSFVLLEMSLFPTPFWRLVFLSIESLVDRFFFFTLHTLDTSLLRVWPPLFLLGSQPLIPLSPQWHVSFSSCCFQEFVFVFQKFDYYAPPCGFLRFSYFGLLVCMDLYVNIFTQFRKSWPSVFRCFFYTTFSLLSFQGSDSTYVGLLNIVLQVSEAFGCFFNHFSVCVSDWIVFIGLTPGSPILPFAIYNLLLSPSGKFFHLFSDIVFLTSRNTILCFHSFRFSVGMLYHSLRPHFPFIV